MYFNENKKIIFYMFLIFLHILQFSYINLLVYSLLLFLYLTIEKVIKNIPKEKYENIIK
jgi:hypothetical protein